MCNPSFLGDEKPFLVDVDDTSVSTFGKKHFCSNTVIFDLDQEKDEEVISPLYVDETRD